MKRRYLIGLCLAFWASFAIAQNVPKPGAKDLCPVCGMLVSKYPNWVAVVTWKDGHAHFFDGAKDMFKFLHDLPKFAPGHKKEDIAAIYVTDFYNLERMDARKALFVTGSDVLGPMGHEFVPLANKADADDFLKDHKGKKIIAFDKVTPEMPVALDAGKF
ncbi:MAG: nitrous oxide reductase accessory protein NosL [Azonexus sp.]